LSFLPYRRTIDKERSPDGEGSDVVIGTLFYVFAGLFLLTIILGIVAGFREASKP
jgi:hypothetical protein